MFRRKYPCGRRGGCFCGRKSRRTALRCIQRRALPICFLACLRHRSQRAGGSGRRRVVQSNEKGGVDKRAHGAEKGTGVRRATFMGWRRVFRWRLVARPFWRIHHHRRRGREMVARMERRRKDGVPARCRRRGDRTKGTHVHESCLRVFRAATLSTYSKKHL